MALGDAYDRRLAYLLDQPRYAWYEAGPGLYGLFRGDTFRLKLKSGTEIEGVVWDIDETTEKSGLVVFCTPCKNIKRLHLF